MLLLISAAIAGDGPWTLAPHERNVYLGSSYVRYDSYDLGGARSVDLGGGGTVATHTVFVATAGLLPGVEAELRLPYETARVVDPSIGVCADKPADFCAPSRGLGDLEAALKVRVVDEFYRSPVSVGLMLAGRSGEAYAHQRGRLTNLGDGQTAVGGGLSLGRSATLGGGWYAVSGTGWYWHRLESGVGLADELAYNADLSWSPRGRFGVGLAGSGFQRFGGRDLGKVDLNQPDAFASLDAAALQAGGKIAIFSGDHSLHVSVLRTVRARNNPTDTWVLSLGVGRFRPADAA